MHLHMVMVVVVVGRGPETTSRGSYAVAVQANLLSPFRVVGAAGRGAALCVLCCRRPGFPVSTVVWPRGGASSKPEAETLLELLPEQLGEPPPGLPPLLLEVLCKLLREPGCASWLQPLPQPQPLPLRWTWHAMGVCRPA